MAVRRGFGTVTPYLLVADVERALAFLRDAFGAKETLRARGGGGGTHVEVRIGDSMLMIGGPAEPGGAMLFVYDPSPDAVHARALAAGGTSVETPNDTPDGRRAAVRDPDGHVWYVGGPPTDDDCDDD